MSLVNSGDDSSDGNTDIDLDHLVCKVDDSDDDITSEKPAESAQAELSTQMIIYSIKHCSVETEHLSSVYRLPDSYMVTEATVIVQCCRVWSNISYCR